MAVTDDIRGFLADQLRINEAKALDGDLPLVQNGIIDSIELMQVVAFLETSYGIAVDETEFLPSNLRTLSTMAAFVERKRG